MFSFNRLWRAALGLLLISSVPLLHARERFHGYLDPGLHSSPQLLSTAIFTPYTAESAAAIGVLSRPGDKIYIGHLDLGSGPVPMYRISAVIIRSPDGVDVLYADADLNAHLDPDERYAFHPLPDRGAGSEEKDVASFSAIFPDDPAGPFPMQVRLLESSRRARPDSGRLRVLYSNIAFLGGYVSVHHHKVRMRFQYNFDTMSVDIAHGREWLDLTGKGHFDMAPGSSQTLQGHGTAPLFRVGNLTLQLVSVDLWHGTFLLRKVPGS